jgi:acyl-CoA dehydrogenase
MGYADLDINLTWEQKSMRDLAKKFGQEVMRPIGIELDKMSDPADVIADGSPLWDAIKQYRELDLHKRGFPKEVGGIRGDIDQISGHLMSEQYGYWDAGLAITFAVAAAPFSYAAISNDPEMLGWAKDYCNDKEGKLIGCWAITEPDHGSDWISAPRPDFNDPKTGVYFTRPKVSMGQCRYHCNPRIASCCAGCIPRNAWIGNLYCTPGPARYFKGKTA